MAGLFSRCFPKFPCLHITTSVGFTLHYCISFSVHLAAKNTVYDHHGNLIKYLRSRKLDIIQVKLSIKLENLVCLPYQKSFESVYSTKIHKFNEFGQTCWITDV